MELFNKEQLQIISDIKTLDKDKRYTKIAIVNLLEILRFGCYLSSELIPNTDFSGSLLNTVYSERLLNKVCSESQRFKNISAYNEDVEILIFRGFKYRRTDTDIADDANCAYVDRAYKPTHYTSLSEYLAHGINNEKLAQYLASNCEHILDTFKELKLLSEIVEYTGQPQAKQFKTKTGYIDIRYASKLKDEPEDGVVVINLYSKKPQALSSKSTALKIAKEKRAQEEQALRPQAPETQAHIASSQEPQLQDRRAQATSASETKCILITHNDLDGIACAYIAKQKGVCDIAYACSRNGLKQLQCRLHDAREVIITDLTPEPEFISEIKPIVIDHHSLGGESLPASVQQMLEDDTCATVLFQRYLEERGFEFSENEKLFIQLVDAYDTHKTESSLFEAADALNKLFLDSLSDGSDKKLIRAVYLLYDKSRWLSSRYEKSIKIINDLCAGPITRLMQLPSNDRVRQINSFVDRRAITIIDNSIVRTDIDGRRYLMFVKDTKNSKGADFELQYVSQQILEQEYADYVIIRYSADSHKASFRSSAPISIPSLKGHPCAGVIEFDDETKRFLRL